MLVLKPNHPKVDANYTNWCGMRLKDMQNYAKYGANDM